MCVSFVLNYEEGGERSVLAGDSGSEAFLSEVIGAETWLGKRNLNIESIYEYGSRAGFWRLHRLLTDYEVPVTVFGVASAMQCNPKAVAAMTSAGWEIASHGLRWIDYRDFSRDDEQRHMEEAIRIQTELTGSRPLGWYTGRNSDHTLDLVVADGGFEYSSDSYADDLPYWVRRGERDHLIVPYTFDANDMRFATAQGFNSGDQFFSYLRDTFDQLYDEGRRGAPKMMSVGLHCRLVGRPGRAIALRRFLDHVKSHSGVWLATRLSIARHWRAHFAASGRPHDGARPPDGARPQGGSSMRTRT